MATKDWKKSVNDELWFYKRADYPTPINSAKETLNAVKSGTGYKIYHTIGGLGNWKLVNKASDKKHALSFMKQYMRTH